MIKVAIRATLATLVLAVLTGLVYPLAITGIAQVGIRSKANGSLLTVGGQVVGSSSIGQLWTGDKWFYGRPSVVSYDASASSGSNLGPTSAALAQQIKDRAAAILKQEGPYNPGLTVAQIPVDLLTASGSGLDPDISEAAALFQVPRIAAARNLSVQAVRTLVLSHVQSAQYGFLGLARVNVLRLNIALSQLTP